MESLPLDVPVGGGWRAIRAQMPGGRTSPFVLITLTDGHYEQFFRVDLQKQIMLDTPTPDVERPVLQELIDAVAAYVRGETG